MFLKEQNSYQKDKAVPKQTTLTPETPLVPDEPITVGPAPTLPPIHKTKQMFEIERQHNWRDIRLILVEKYNELGSQAEVAKYFGVTQPVVDDWAGRLGITFTVKRFAYITNVNEPVAA